MFTSVPANVSFPALENEMGQFWKTHKIYEQSLAQRHDKPRFVFYEGPPTANGMPHPGHCLTRAIKDLFPRYRTMRGYLCERKAGWDTHGLPVEVEVCKELGIHSKEEIEAFGVEPFIHKCQESVWRYMQEWERLTERVGFWVDLKSAYVTYHQSFVESVWWSLKQLFDRGLLYQGHKIVWWWAQGGTALSSGEVGQGYREVADPSVYVKFPLLDSAGKPTDTSLLVWTTTPWTLPSNQFAAVHPELEYAIVIDEHDGKTEKLVIASALVEAIGKKVGREYRVEDTIKGADLLGRRYLPPFDYFYRQQGEQQGTLTTGGRQHIAWRVVAADFVTTDSGSGVVHQAPAFGEVDYDVLRAEEARFQSSEGPDLICAVASDGKFTEDAHDYEGRWVKDCDKDITRNLKQRGLLYHQEQYLHEYPFCWRAENDPLIQYPRQSWFIRTSEFKQPMLANNSQINWLPEHIKDGRFGNFLESNVDWALSRERYWGTPLPIWVCEQTGQMEAVGSYEELLKKPGVKGTEVWAAAKAKNPKLVDDLKVHKPYIDAITYDSPFAAGAQMKRVTEVIDCWYDSGAMPFAQWGYRGEQSPAGAADNFAAQFPADFISEALDQTRGWFYSQLAISTLLFGEQKSQISNPKSQTNSNPETSPAHLPTPSPLHSSFPYPHPFRNCIVLGLMLGEDGQKMSKSKRNYREPNEIFDKYGADALRWYFFANQPPWTSIRYSERAIKDSIPEFLLRLWNVFSFFTIYANIDGFEPEQQMQGVGGQLTPEMLARGSTYRRVDQRSELDRWILSELHRTLTFVTEKMDAYDNYAACGRLTEFVDALSNWYVRRSRDRFWHEDRQDPDKLDAYWTLYECLTTTCKLVAPFVPFIAERMWQTLAAEPFAGRVPGSVHLCDYPTGQASEIDADLSRRMDLVREISSLGRAARMNSKLKVRQPLAKVEVVLADKSEQDWLVAHAGLIAEELNVKTVEYAAQADQYIDYTILPDLKRLGPRLGKRLPVVKQALGKVDGGLLLATLEKHDQYVIALPDGDIVLDKDDIQVRLAAKEGWAAAQGKACVVVLSTELTPTLVREGLAREIVHAVQTQRKDQDCDYTDRIEVTIVTASADIAAAVQEHETYIKNETLAVRVTVANVVPAGVSEVEVNIAGEAVQLVVVKC